jgi:hypothetical protein
MPEPSLLDARLAEIDRRLRTIQSDLVSVPDASAAPADEPAEEEAARVLERDAEPLRLVEPAEPTETAPAASAASAASAGRLAELVAAHERLLELHRELLSQYAEVLERRAGESATVALTAGPFASAGTVREFERALASLPGVSAVTVREYLGGDQVQIDVQLAAGG